MSNSKEFRLKREKIKNCFAAIFKFSGFQIFKFVLFLTLQVLFLYKANAQTFNSFAVNRNTFYSASIDSLAKDSTKTRKKINWHSPSMVALQSAVLPGLGQISNGKLHILKVPVIYAGFAVCGYFINFNNKEYVKFRDAYHLRVDGDSQTIDIYSPEHPDANYTRGIFSDQSLLSQREFYRKNRDLTIIITAGVYFANILDAYVFAHLKDFDVSDDLSLAIKPVSFSNIAGRNQITTGLQLKFK
jgi:hypothetical protein